MELRYFEISEFDSKDLKGSGANMNPEFLQMIDQARAVAGIPFKINSGFRTVARNQMLPGAKSNSSHLKGMAADIACVDSISRLKIITAALSVGFRRVGVHSKFIHIDNDDTKPAACWVY